MKVQFWWLLEGSKIIYLKFTHFIALYKHEGKGRPTRKGLSFCLLFLLSSINKYFLSTYCGCWTLSEVLGIQDFSWTERRAYICRMDPPLPCISVTSCLFSCPEFFCGMNNNNKSIPLVGPGILGQASGRVQAGNSGRKQMSPLLLRETTPCPCMTASTGPLSCLPAPSCPRIRDSGSL